MIEPYSEYLSVWCNWLYVLVVSRTRFRVNPHSIVAWMPKNSLLEAGARRRSHLNFRFRTCFEQGVPWYSGSYRVWIHSETRTWHDKNIQSNADTDKYSEHSPIIWPVLANGWVFVYELNGSGFQSSCSHLNFSFRVCFEQRVPWDSGNYRVPIHSETRTWYDQNISHKVLVVLVLSSATVTEVN